MAVVIIWRCPICLRALDGSSAFCRDCDDDVVPMGVNVELATALDALLDRLSTVEALLEATRLPSSAAMQAREYLCVGCRAGWIWTIPLCTVCRAVRLASNAVTT